MANSSIYLSDLQLWLLRFWESKKTWRGTDVYALIGFEGKSVLRLMFRVLYVHIRMFKVFLKLC